MKRRGCLFASLVSLLVIACFCLSTLILGGFLRLRARPMLADTSTGFSDEPAPDLSPTRRQPLTLEEQTARTIAQSSIPSRDLLELARRLEGLSLPDPSEGPDPLPSYEMGDRKAFWLHNLDSSAFFTATTVLAYQTAHAYWWVEDGYEVDEVALAMSARNFEMRTYPTNRRVFGSEWTPGIDGDPHIYIFLGNVPGVGGYFSSPDEYPNQVRPYSNQHEMFYISLDNAQPGSAYFDGILAHEFQHMILWAVDRDEDTWVNEGLSELASHINGYDVGGSDSVFASQPDTQLTTWPELEASGPHYGASYLFLTYFMQHYGEGGISRLAAEPANGIAGFDIFLAEAGSPYRRFEDLFADWVVANYLDDTRLGSGRYGYADLKLDPPKLAAHHTSLPVKEDAAVHQYATDYILIEAEKPLEFWFTGNPLVSLVGNQAHSGDYQWWSNRGDEGDAILTRAFDLTGLERATLRAWMWYDLESDYDYAYVQVSTDGGRTWHILANENTTSSNPNGNNYGSGFTGRSGSQERASWVWERFDLSPYAGQPILVRFEVITDDTVTGPGLCLDDISIPELRYTTDVETGADRWRSNGWLRVTSQVPQDFIVQLISLGRETHIRRLALDEQMQGGFTLSGMGQEVDRVVLVVSALAPATTERATYSYQIRER